MNRSDIYDDETLFELERDRKRLAWLLSMYDGCKWRDSGPLSSLKPDDEKYITESSLKEALDFLIANENPPGNIQ